ncbi:MAG: sulfatase-like hydrolase/transferase [bacterium]
MTNRQPNFIVILTDDQGWGDLGANGAPGVDDLATPHLDRLAETGVRCTQWYSNSPVCSASRAALLTGRVPQRAGVPGNVSPAWDARGLSEHVTTFAEAIRDLGYATCMSGKWHLGQAEPDRPHRRGFEDWFGFLHGCIDYYSHIFYWCLADNRPPRHDLWDNNREIHRDGEYIIDLITERALEQLRRVARERRPFFLYLPFNAPHYPIHAPRHWFDQFAHLPEARRLTAVMMAVYDAAVGRIVDELEKLGLRQNTCIVCSSDHGPSREPRNWPDGREAVFPGGSTGGLRGAKFSLFDGGIRVPTVMSWPAQLPSGQVCDELGAHMDLFPTLLRAAGGDPEKYEVDGRNVLKMLRGEASAPRRDLCWQIGEQRAIRRGDWKLVLNGFLPGEQTKAHEVHLSHLGDDPGEQRNLADQEPQRREAMRAALEEWSANLVAAARASESG